MTESDKAAGKPQGKSGKESAKLASKVEKPDWAGGLKRFYDSVVDEPLPDDLANLLARLDAGEAGGKGE